MPSRKTVREIDLNLLRVFDAMARHGSVSRAGTSLGLSQPAMSYLLGRLRRELGDPLFELAGQRMHPTARAESIAPAVREILDLVRTRILDTPTFDPPATTRTFRMMLTDVGGYAILPRLLPVLRAEAPHARFEVVELASGDLERALAAGDVDLAIGVFPDLPGSILQQRLYERDFVVVHGRAHPPLPARVSLARYLELDHIAVRSPVRTRGTVDAALRSLGRQRRIVLTVPHWLVVPPILARSPMVATVPRELEEAFRLHGETRSVPVPFKLGATTLRQYWHSRFTREPGGRWLRELVRRALVE